MKKIITLFTIIFFVSCGVVYAEGYTNGSIKGKWAVVCISGANNLATVGPTTCDENGSCTGTAIMNAPGLLKPRRLRIETTSAGTFEVNPDGTALGTMTFTTDTGLSVTVHCDGMATKAEVADGAKIATEIFFIFQEPGTLLLQGKLGEMTTCTGTRLPD